MERNIRRMAEFYADKPCKLRPHFKAHKTPAIARRQLAAGSCTGLTVATVGEAELVAEEGFCDDVLIANEILGPGKAARAAKLAKQIDLKVAIDSDATLDDLASAARAEGVEIGVLVDVNVGLPRCGIAHGEPALALAQARARDRRRSAARPDGLRGPRRRPGEPRGARGARREGDGPPARDGSGSSATPACPATSSARAAPARSTSPA